MTSGVNDEKLGNGIVRGEATRVRVSNRVSNRWERFIGRIQNRRGESERSYGWWVSEWVVAGFIRFTGTLFIPPPSALGGQVSFSPLFCSVVLCIANRGVFFFFKKTKIKDKLKIIYYSYFFWPKIFLCHFIEVT